jgi:hypothetical protein
VFVRADLHVGAVQRRVAVRPRIPELRVRQGQLNRHLLDIVAVEPEGALHLQGRTALEVIGCHPDQKLTGHDPAIQVTQPRSQHETREVALFEARLAMHPLGDDMPNLLEQDRPPETHRDMPDVLLAKAPEFAARIRLRI